MIGSGHGPRLGIERVPVLAGEDMVNTDQTRQIWQCNAEAAADGSGRRPGWKADSPPLQAGFPFNPVQRDGRCGGVEVANENDTVLASAGDEVGQIAALFILHG